MPDGWLRCTVQEVLPGAWYEGVTYDQDIVVSSGHGTVITLFDMTPMVGEDLKIGLDVDLLVVVAAPGNLRLDKSSSNEFEVLAVESVPSVPNGVAARREVHKRRWIALRGSFGPVWMAAGEFEIAEIAPVPGLMVTWEDARYDLYAWCPVAAA